MPLKEISEKQQRSSLLFFEIEKSHFCFRSPMYKVFSSGAKTFKTVLKFGVVLPFSILVITGCFTPFSFFRLSLGDFFFLSGVGQFSDESHT